MLEQIVVKAISKPELCDIVMLLLTCYVFLLRLPSEGIPLAAHESRDDVEVPVIKVKGDACFLVHLL